MVKRLIAIAFIFACTSAGWLILGVTILARTDSSGEQLRGKVQSIWGAPHVQTALVAEYNMPVSNNVQMGSVQTVTRQVRPFSSDIGIDLRSEPWRIEGIVVGVLRTELPRQPAGTYA